MSNLQYGPGVMSQFLLGPGPWKKRKSHHCDVLRDMSQWPLWTGPGRTWESHHLGNVIIFPEIDQSCVINFPEGRAKARESHHWGSWPKNVSQSLLNAGTSSKEESHNLGTVSSNMSQFSFSVEARIRQEIRVTSLRLQAKDMSQCILWGRSRWESYIM